MQLSSTPIIIGGCARSGTTLLQAVLSAHPKVQAVPAEPRIFKKYPYSSPVLNRTYHHLQLLNLLARHPVKPSADRWIEKTPKNVLYFENIIREFQNQVFLIHIIRDGRDVVTSKHPARPDQYFVSPQHWAKQVKAGLKWKDHPQVITVKYEELIMDFEKTVEGILSLLGLETSEKIMNFQRHTSIQKPRSLPATIETVHNRSIGQWKEKIHEHRMEEFYQCQEALSLLPILGYDL